MKANPPARDPRRTLAVPILVLLAAAACCVPAGWRIAALWRGLPSAQVAALDREAAGRAFQDARSRMSTTTATATNLTAIGRQFTRALHDDAALAGLRSSIGGAVANTSTSQLGRLLQAGVAMLALERAGKPIDQWPATIEPYLSGLSDASFAHLQLAVIDHTAGVLHGLGVGPGTSVSYADVDIKHPFGPFLQYFITRLDRLARASASSSAPTTDASASRPSGQPTSAYQRIANRLLRQWVLDPGTSGVRLLAADLLVERLRPASDASSQRVAADLRKWTSAFRDAARQRPPAILDLRPQPALCLVEHDRLQAWLALTAWTAIACLAAGAMTLACSWAWLLPRVAWAPTRRWAIVAFVILALLITAGWTWNAANHEGVVEDLRRVEALAGAPDDNRAGLHWPMLPIVAAILTVGAIATTGLIGRTTLARIANVGATAAAVFLLLGISLAVIATVAEAARTRYENALAAAYHQGEIEVIAGPSAGALLESLRQWQP